MMPDSAAVHASKSLNVGIEREFKKSFLKSLDWSFTGLFAAVFVLETVGMLILSGRPIPELNEKQITRIQENYARFVELAKKPMVDTKENPLQAGEESGTSEEAGGSEGSSDGSGENRPSNDNRSSGTGTGGTSIESRLAMRIANAGMRREQINREVSNVGILWLLTGTGTGGTGRAAVNHLDLTGSGSGTGTGGDLDQALAGAGGLKTSAGSGLGSGGSGTGGGVRGGRSGQAAGIEDLVSDMGTAPSRSMSRKGQLTAEAPSDVAGQGRKSIYRSPEAIQEVLQAHVPAIRYCYERELKRNPELKGKVTVRIIVAPDGSVRDAAIVASTLNNERVERCIISRIKLWKDFKSIGASDGDVVFRQVYTFGY